MRLNVQFMTCGERVNILASGLVCICLSRDDWKQVNGGIFDVLAFEMFCIFAFAYDIYLFVR